MESLLLAASLFLPLNVSPVAPSVPATVGVPFGCGHSYVVSQAHDTGSHLQNDTWAWDFRMPSGTPIVAAMDGQVRLARGDSTAGGCDPAMARFANYVVLAHANGLETQYLHFTEVVVKPGQQVKAGELIGYSGETGWACGPHLHFKVTTAAGPGWNNPSVPAGIEGYGDPQRDVLIRAPACQGNQVMMASRPEKPLSTTPAEALASNVAPNTPASTLEVRQAAANVLDQMVSSPGSPATAKGGSTVVPASYPEKLRAKEPAPAMSTPVVTPAGTPSDAASEPVARQGV